MKTKCVSSVIRGNVLSSADDYAQAITRAMSEAIRQSIAEMGADTSILNHSVVQVGLCLIVTMVMVSGEDE